MTRSSSLGMRPYSTEPRARKYVKWYGFLSFSRKYRKKLLDKGLDPSKKVLHKAGENLGDKVANLLNKSNEDNTEKQEGVEEMIIPPEKKRGNIKQTEKSITKMERYKISKLLKDSTVSKFVTKK